MHKYCGHLVKSWLINSSITMDISYIHIYYVIYQLYDRFSTLDEKSQICLVVDLPLWRNMSSSVGIMHFPTKWKVIKFMLQTTNQKFLLFCRWRRFAPPPGWWNGAPWAPHRHRDRTFGSEREHDVARKGHWGFWRDINNKMGCNHLKCGYVCVCVYIYI